MSSNNEVSTANRLLELSRKATSVVLCHFQINHDLCASSGFFPNQTLMKIDQCARSFRDLGLETVTVARLTSSNWISTVIVFYENIGKVHDGEVRKRMFENLGGQAQKLGKIFAVIAAWARIVSGQIDAAGKEATGVSTKFIEKYDSELKSAEAILTKAKSDLQTAEDNLNAARDNRDDYEIGLKAAAASIILGPIGLALGFGLAGSGYAAADEAVHTAEAAEEQARKDVQDAQAKFNQAKDLDERAEHIGNVTATLVKALQFMTLVTDELAIFWTKQSNNFISRASKMITNEPNLPEGLLPAIAPEDIEFWKHSMEDFNTYVEVMTRINNLYNYTNEAPQIPTTTLQVAELSFTMHIPSNVEVASIMN